MEKIIIIKNNNNITKSNINDYNNYNFDETENLLDILQINKEDIDKIILSKINVFIKNAITKLKINKNIDYITSILQSSNPEKEILNIYHEIINNYNNLTNKYIEKTKNYNILNYLSIKSKTNKIIIEKIISKELINIYVTNIIKNIPKENLNNLYMMCIKNEDFNDILKELNITLNNNFNYLLQKYLTKAINRQYENTFPHLCWENCENVNNCTKIDDRVRKTINNYNFITKGYQIIAPKYNNKTKYTIEIFYVSECQNYKKKTRTK